MEGSRGMPSLLFLIVTYLGSAFAILYYLSLSSQVELLLYSTGLLLFFGGYAGRLLSLRAIWKSYSLLFEPQGAEIARNGVYAFVRHPIYSFYVLETMGILFLRPNPISLTALIILILTCIHRANEEEKELHKKFPDAYMTYCQSTKRFIPFIY